MELVYVEWLDHSGVSEWSIDPPALEPYRCRSVGWVLGENEQTLCLASCTSVKEPNLATTQRQYIVKAAITWRCQLVTPTEPLPCRK